MLAIYLKEKRSIWKF